MTVARVSQVAVEVLRSNAATNARVSQIAVEVVRINDGTKIIDSQLAVEVIRPNIAEQSIPTGTTGGTAIRFPVNLPLPDPDNYGDSNEEIRSAFQPEIGAIRTRNKYRRAPRLFQVSFFLNQAKYEQLSSFYYRSIKQGELEFDIKLVDGDELELSWFTVNWIGQFEAQALTGGQWRVNAVFRSIKDKFDTRPSGTDELAGLSISEAINSGYLDNRKLLYGVVEVEITNTAKSVDPMRGLVDINMIHTGKLVHIVMRGENNVEITNVGEFSLSETNNRITKNGDTRVTKNGNTRVHF